MDGAQTTCVTFLHFPFRAEFRDEREGKFARRPLRGREVLRGRREGKRGEGRGKEGKRGRPLMKEKKGKNLDIRDTNKKKNNNKKN